MTKPTVYIIGYSEEYSQMFKGNGWEIVDTMIKADLIQFTGGEDVSPYLYGEELHPETRSNVNRDKKEQLLFNLALKNNIPMAGICRGGQFLNVMCGGKMWQHIKNHAINGTHTVFDIHKKEYFQATSTHHQMMRPTKDALIIGVVTNDSISSFRETCTKVGSIIAYFPDRKSMSFNDKDIEIVFYKEQRVLCFQPHPEFRGYNFLAERYMSYIKDYLGIV